MIKVNTQPVLTLNNATFCTQNVFICFVWNWEWTAVISLCSTNWLIFTVKTLWSGLNI